MLSAGKKNGMDENDLIKAVSENAEVDESTASTAVDAVFNSIKDSLISGEAVEIVGFGKFHTKRRKASTGRDPKSGATLVIPAATVPSFQAGQVLKDAAEFGSASKKNGMNNIDLIKAISKKAGVSVSTAKTAVEAVFNSITESLASGEKVVIAGFGTFLTKKRAASIGRNPKSGAPLVIPAATVPIFRAEQLLSDAVK